MNFFGQMIGSGVLYYIVYIIYVGLYITATAEARKNKANEAYNQIAERIYIGLWFFLGIIGISTFTDKFLALSMFTGPVSHLYIHLGYHSSKD